MDCPFCGSDDLGTYYTRPNYPDASTIFVACHKCLSQGPKKDTEERAFDAWNMRKKSRGILANGEHK
jgi:Lar family restriction alleviation protein